MKRKATMRREAKMMGLFWLSEGMYNENCTASMAIKIAPAYPDVLDVIVVCIACHIISWNL